MMICTRTTGRKGTTPIASTHSEPLRSAEDRLALVTIALHWRAGSFGCVSRQQWHRGSFFPTRRTLWATLASGRPSELGTCSVEAANGSAPPFPVKHRREATAPQPQRSAEGASAKSGEN